MNLDIDNITKTDIYDALTIITNEINQLARDINYDQNGASTMPYTMKDMSLKISEAYTRMDKSNKFVYSTRIKPIFFSRLLSFIRVSGIYIPLTGEANVNINYSDFIITSTSAHEMAHQRGVSKENEACFVGFLALSSSQDKYLKYSGYLDAYGKLLSSLEKEDKNLYNKILRLIDKRAVKDYNLQAEQSINHSSEKLENSSNKLNDSYLQVNGVSEGIKSYEKANLLIVSYMTRR